MKNNAIVIILLVLFIGGYVAYSRGVFTPKEVVMPVPATSDEVTGTVVSVDTDQAMADGPVVVFLENAGKSYTIAVPSFGLLLCPAHENIASPFDLRPGDVIAVKGSADEAGTIVPCEDASHYLRIVSKAPGSPVSGTSTASAGLGQKASLFGVSVTPKQIVSDSRCPMNARCIWAGIVEVKAVVESTVAHGENNFKLGEAKTFGEYSITLTEVRPDAPEAGVKIPDASYVFTFEIKKR